MTVKRDPETGQVATINGLPGRALAWLRVFQPAILLVIGMIVIPLTLFHFKEHTKIHDFMSEGARVTPETLSLAVGGLKSELIETGALPMAAKRLSDLEKDVGEIKEDVKKNSLTLAIVSTEVSAIHRILKDS